MTKACKKWERLYKDKMKDYEVSIKICSCCRIYRSEPYLVHEIGGDYDCYKCGKDVFIRHTCVYCNNK
jgi:hypothetical protein